MNTSDRSYDLDMTQVGDEELAVLAKECQFRPARDELLLRFREFSDGLIWCKARGLEFGHAEIEDARQDAVFWVVEAIQCYDTRELGARGGCTFRTFLYRVLTSRFSDFVKHFRRQKRRFGLLVGGDSAVAAIGSNRRSQASDSDRLERLEWESRLSEALDSLDASARQLWERLTVGRTLRQIAAETNCSYPTLKFRKRKLFETLRVRVRQVVQPRRGESP